MWEINRLSENNGLAQNSLCSQKASYSELAGPKKRDAQGLKTGPLSDRIPMSIQL